MNFSLFLFFKAIYFLIFVFVCMCFGLPPSPSHLQVEPGKPGAEVSKKKTISQRKNLPIECAQGDQRLRCPNRSMVVVC